MPEISHYEGSRSASFRDGAWEASMRRNTNEWLDHKVTDWVSKGWITEEAREKYGNLTAGMNKELLF